MHIYAQKGHKVICATFDAGYPSQRAHAEKHLVVGQEYTVDHTVVHNWHTDVFLEELPDLHFNSVFFDNAPIKSE